MAVAAPGRRGTTTPIALDDGAGLGRPPKRRLWARVPSSLSVAFVAGILAFAGFLVVTASHSGTQVAVAARDIAAGEVLDAAALRYEDVTVPASVRQTLLSAADVAALKDTVATRTIPGGSMVARSDFGAASPQRSMSVPVDPEHAVGGSLRVGDVVDVLDGGAPDASGQAPYVVTGAQVLAVADRLGSAGLSRSSKYWVTIALDSPGEAQRLATAIERGKVDIVRSTGAPAASPSPGASTPGR